MKTTIERTLYIIAIVLLCVVVSEVVYQMVCIANNTTCIDDILRKNGIIIYSFDEYLKKAKMTTIILSIIWITTIFFILQVYWILSSKERINLPEFVYGYLMKYQRYVADKLIPEDDRYVFGLLCVIISVQVAINALFSAIDILYYITIVVSAFLITPLILALFHRLFRRFNGKFIVFILLMDISIYLLCNTIMTNTFSHVKGIEEIKWDETIVCAEVTKMLKDRSLDLKLYSTSEALSNGVISVSFIKNNQLNVYMPFNLKYSTEILNGKIIEEIMLFDNKAHFKFLIFNIIMSVIKYALGYYAYAKLSKMYVNKHISEQSSKYLCFMLKTNLFNILGIFLTSILKNIIIKQIDTHMVKILDKDLIKNVISNIAFSTLFKSIPFKMTWAASSFLFCETVNSWSRIERLLNK